MSLAGAGAVLLVYPLVQGRELGWPLWILGMLAASVPVLGAFARHQIRRKRSGAATLVEPSVFRNRSYVSGAGFAMVFLGAMGGLTLALTGLMQIGLGYSAIEASLTSAPYALGGFVGSAIGGMTMGKLGRTVLHAGLAIKAVGVVALYVVLELAGTGVGHLHFTAPLLVAGIGMGMVFVPLFDIILAGVADHEVGSASGVLQALQQLGMSLGVAGLGTLFFGLVGSQAGRAADFVAAAEPTILVTVALLAAAFAIGFLLPKHARRAAAYAQSMRSAVAAPSSGRSRGVRVPLLVGRDLEERHDDAGGVARGVVLGHEAVQAQLEIAELERRASAAGSAGAGERSGWVASSIRKPSAVSRPCRRPEAPRSPSVIAGRRG